VAVLDEPFKVNGEDDSPVDQQVTFAGSDFALRRMLAEFSARVLQGRINGEQWHHLPWNLRTGG